MKKGILLSLSFFILFTSFGFNSKSFPISSTMPASELFVVVGKGAEKISLLELSKISVKDYQNLSGTKFNLFQRISFKMAQKKLKHDIKSDGTINTATYNKFYSNEDHTTGFHVGGFALGLFIPLIGVGIAYLIGGEARKNRANWAWAGTALSLGVLKLLIK